MSATTTPARHAWTCHKCRQQQPRGSVRYQYGWCKSCDELRLERGRRLRGPRVYDPGLAVTEIAARRANETRDIEAAAAEAARLRLEELGEVARLMTQLPRR